MRLLTLLFLLIVFCLSGRLMATAPHVIVNRYMVIGSYSELPESFLEQLTSESKSRVTARKIEEQKKLQKWEKQKKTKRKKSLFKSILYQVRSEGFSFSQMNDADKKRIKNLIAFDGEVYNENKDSARFLNKNMIAGKMLAGPSEVYLTDKGDFIFVEYKLPHPFSSASKMVLFSGEMLFDLSVGGGEKMIEGLTSEEIEINNVTLRAFMHKNSIYRIEMTSKEVLYLDQIHLMVPIGKLTNKEEEIIKVGDDKRTKYIFDFELETTLYQGPFKLKMIERSRPLILKDRVKIWSKMN